MRRAAVPFLVALCLLGIAGAAGAASPPAGFIDTTVTNALSPATSMVWDASSARLFVTEQGGDLRIVEDGALLPTPALHLTVDSSGERGLLGVELDPNFASNHFLYLYYTVPGSPPHNRVSRFTESGDTVSAASEVVLDNLDNLSGATNHNGGGIHFGSDGKLYFGAGENANPSNSQTLTNQLGKIMRMNSNGSIPTDNPFYNTASGQNRLIYVLGLRNPFTFAFGSGGLFINDVGQNTYEEINVGSAGANYGWPNAEGPADPPNPAYTDPLFCYRHNLSDPNCNSTSLIGSAITGGTFYDPPVAYFPADYVGDYFFSDLGSGFIARLDRGAGGNAVTTFATGASSPVDLDTGPDGSLYYLEYGGRVGRISYQQTPTVSDFSPGAGPAGQNVTINGTYLASATGVTFNGVSATFSVVWDTRLVATVPAGAANGPSTVTTGAGPATSGSSFTVTPGPTPSISSFVPTGGPVGTSVTINGTGLTDASAVTFDGTPAASFSVDSDSQITAEVADGTTTGPISVTGPGGTDTTATDFTVAASPLISGFSPAGGKPGKAVTIRGLHLTGATAVTFHGTPAQTFTVKSDRKIRAVVALGSTTGVIAVTTPGGTATSAASFVVPPPPTVTGFAPAQGPAGTTITITGTGFKKVKSVTINGTPAKSLHVLSSTTLTAVVRPGTASGQIRVTTPNGTGTGAGTFTVT